ncbi:thiamine phosphate synthase [Noviherbaspirillum sp. Root189]|uniref:thiamine phosphate synthase n=1 Tax=Noviherbaspirillum sp. Root189 TaxID=1736487 RepID=UPI00070AAFA8|nr:thiamine phosphate synthase [Noviherbaspirillum sp. Root189]KRB88566.1 thiamine-phosphate pyrophosphorylase [Noviherbaspirillum sp. Root189]
MKGLYLVTPDWDDTQKLLQTTEAGLRGGAAFIQYRHKTASPELRHEQARELQRLCRKYGRPFIINDHLDLCIALNADGIHVGGTDASVAEARKVVGPSKIVGASCYGTLQLAQDAQAAGASYVAFGGFYPSRVKKYDFKTPPDIVTQARESIPLPSVVIGGMTQENAAPLVALGADMVAVISSVYMVEDPESAARGFARLFTGLSD